MNTAQLLYWIREREAIRIRRANGDPRPWTDDKILRDWSFCNVCREDDRTTRWIADNWRAPHAEDPDVWFAMAVARFVNFPDTLAALGYPVPWEPEHFLQVLNERKARDEVCFGAAYNISNGGKTTPKAEHLVQQVFASLWGPLTRKRLRPRDDDTLHSFYGRLKGMPGFDSFMAGQVVPT
jgi:alpha-glutamyl/putrescinyl thymine pyrophosphorylase clade 1